MASEELGGFLFLAGYGLLFLGAIKVFGIRRVLWFLTLIVVLAASVAFKTLGVVTGSRR